MSSKKVIKIISAIGTITFGLLTFLPFAFAQSSGVTQIGAGNLAIDTSPQSFIFSPITISSATDTYFEYYVNGETSTEELSVHDGRFDGGFQLTVQSSSYTSGSNTIANTNLCTVTNTGSTVIDEILLGAPAAVYSALDGDPAISSTDYNGQCFSASPLVLFVGQAAGTTEGRVGAYTAYPSFRLNIPTSTVAGVYSNTITYTISDDST
ncbi:hypothetical protein ACFL2V_19055 [Pseudomonadota bacterium]